MPRCVVLPELPVFGWGPWHPSLPFVFRDLLNVAVVGKRVLAVVDLLLAAVQHHLVRHVLDGGVAPATATGRERFAAVSRGHPRSPPPVPVTLVKVRPCPGVGRVASDVVV